MITVIHHGNFNKIERFLKKPSSFLSLQKYGDEGVRVLSEATPLDSGETATSWNYKVEIAKNTMRIVWTNSNIVNGAPIAILLQYGHGTRNGGYVQGRDYINPAMKPIFDKMTNKLWEEVTRQ